MLDYVHVCEYLKNQITDYAIIEERTISSTSDHLPIIVKIQILNSPHTLLPNTNKWPAWHKMCTDTTIKYCKQLKNDLNHTHLDQSKVLTTNDINTYSAENFNAVIKKSTKLTIPMCSYNPHTKPYWNSTVNDAHKNEMELRIRWIKEGRPRGMQHTSYTEYKRAKHHFRRCQESASQEFIRKTNEDIDSCYDR
jgi:exonuclease III